MQYFCVTSLCHCVTWQFIWEFNRDCKTLKMLRIGSYLFVFRPFIKGWQGVDMGSLWILQPLYFLSESWRGTHEHVRYRTGVWERGSTSLASCMLVVSPLMCSSLIATKKFLDVQKCFLFFTVHNTSIDDIVPPAASSPKSHPVLPSDSSSWGRSDIINQTQSSTAVCSE